MLVAPHETRVGVGIERPSRYTAEANATGHCLWSRESFTDSDPHPNDTRAWVVMLSLLASASTPRPSAPRARASRERDTAKKATSASSREPREWQSAFAGLAAGCYLGATVAGGLAAFPPPASASFLDDMQEPSIMGLKLKERTQEVILETKAEYINQDFSHSDLQGAIYTEADLRGSDFSGSDLRAVIFSRAIMPGVNFEGSDMQSAFLDYVVLRGSNFRGVIATNANFTRSDLGECDVTDADFTEAVIDRYQAIGLCETASGTNKFTGVDTRESLGCDYLKRYEGSGGAGKVAVTKGSGTWGGGK
jgi:hypothetical protein